LLTAMCEALNSLGPTEVTETDFSYEKLPLYLFFNFALINQDGKIIDKNRELDKLQIKYSKQSEQEFEELPLDQLEIEGITDWSFGDLPEHKDIDTPMGQLTVYPALVDEKESVRLKYFSTKKDADSYMKQGLIRLIKLSLKNKMQYMQKNLAHIDKQCMYYSAIGQCNELKIDLIDFIVSSVFLMSGESINSKKLFDKLIDEKQTQLLDAAIRVCNINLDVLKSYNECKKKLKTVSNPLLLEALADVQEQLNHLVYRRYLIELDIESLNSLPRYIKAIIRRLDKLDSNVMLDRKNMLEAKKYWNKYNSLKVSRSESNQDLTKLRWMIEEYRVSLWAQELKTRYPISSKRLDEQIKRLN